MNDTLRDLIPWILPIILLAVFWAYLLRRRRKETRNTFRTGSPVKLERNIEIETFISRDEYIEVNRQVTQRLMGGKRKGLFIFLFVIVMLTIFTPALTTGEPVNTPELIGNIAGVIIAIAILYFVYKKAIKSSAGRAYDTTEFMKDKVKYVFTAENFEVVSAVTSGKANWETVHGYMMLDRFIILYTGLIVGYFLKKSDFKPDDLAAFQRFLENNFEAKKSVV